MATQLLETLNAIHHLGIVHNDIKHENCLYNTKTNQVTLIDFDLAEYHKLGTLWKSSPIGTMCYLPPEMLNNEDVDHKGDLWRLGMMLAEIVLLTQLKDTKDAMHLHSISYENLNRKAK